MSSEGSGEVDCYVAQAALCTVESGSWCELTNCTGAKFSNVPQIFVKFFLSQRVRKS